ncbi:protein EFFECTOR OF TRANSCRIPTION 2 [Chenopodium quinoa]|uniref:Protein EFFECTOR OF TRANSCRIPTION 2-like n=1 Tax=Chenopodium quinoa TaxID=63459 RepID=A0A803MD66_CHEQI|nr:protein EFFECTOR OF TRANSCRIPTION 2 [Chenopodium quinoa]
MGGEPQGLPTPTTTPRLKRENYRQTKHDTAFSKWKILIGPSDWVNYEAKKEGAERYRVANLPSVCNPGLYEIGVAVCHSDSGRDVSKLDTEFIVVVYLGQADNVRSRLQDYGRNGSHLINGCGLFKEIFSRGYPIVYRWAPLKSKSDAERTEAKLLERFDYAWNKVNNGVRRPNDVLTKIEKISIRNNKIPKILKMLQSFSERKVGIQIKAEKFSLGNKPSHDIYEENFNLFDRVFKFSRSQPRLVSTNPEAIVEDINKIHICGVISNDGTICSNSPFKGRKRCSEHKGRRLTSVSINSKIMTKDSSTDNSQVENFVNDEFSSICGVILLDSSPCTKSPFPGRKRCEEHKGMRINQIMSKSLIFKSVIEKPLSDPDPADCCGVNLGDGKCCERQPVKGRKRHEQHKGMHVNACV